MRPAARAQAAIELIEEIDTASRAEGAPADRIVGAYFRARRYAGSKDRRAVTDMVYGVLRSRGALAWRLNESGLPQNPRDLVGAHLVLTDATALDEWSPEDAHGPAALSDEERAGFERLAQLSEPAMPGSARHNIPEWLNEVLEARYGAELDAVMDGMAGRAATDIRVNVLKASPKSDGLEGAEPCPYSPMGLRLSERVNLSQVPAYRDGLIEVQDESSQIAAILCGAEPGEQVIDYCAGAGGKALALAALMENKGQIYAFDLDWRRLGRLPERAQKAGARNIQIVRELGALPEKADAVLLDVPCSASGTWRRNPDLRWRLTSERLENFEKVQRELLEEGAKHVRPGGRLIYSVCSILPGEGEAQIEAFLGANADFHLRPYTDVWPFEDRSAPETASVNPGCLLLLPHRHGCDGFFVAVLERAE